MILLLTYSIKFIFIPSTSRLQLNQTPTKKSYSSIEKNLTHLYSENVWKKRRSEIHFFLFFDKRVPWIRCFCWLGRSKISSIVIFTHTLNCFTSIFIGCRKSLKSFKARWKKKVQILVMSAAVCNEERKLVH